MIAVEKPAGLLVQADRSGDPDLLSVTRDWLKKKYRKPGNVFLGLVHRLDKPVRGVVVFGKTSKGASRLSESFRTRAVKKTYWAVVEGKPKASDELHHVVDDKDAHLSYRRLRSEGSKALLEIDLHTGRKHQIREQLSQVGCPIVGDKAYGSRFALRGEIALVAKRLQFPHPTKEESVTVEIPDDDLSLPEWLS